jgi:hypothetical protein
MVSGQSNMNPNFHTMSKAALRNYVLSHRHDEEAFHLYVDRLATEEGRVTYPPLQSIEDLENYPELLQSFKSDPGRRAN